MLSTIQGNRLFFPIQGIPRHDWNFSPIQGINSFSEIGFSIQYKVNLVLVLLFRIHLVVLVNQSDHQFQFKVYLVLDMTIKGVP